MDSRTRIDYALFHLTPTRTRCDLVIFANGQSEKLASGLLQPFLLHLKCAKEQIEKGGYSITLTPPAPATWFTKGTLQRFVRFVSSPDVLERFVSIEKEIEQIEDSIRSNELACEEVDANGKEVSADRIHNKTTVSELNDEINGTNHAENEEHSKVHLQRVLETRKAVLHKEQAMAYARALVTGFQTNHLEALILFAYTFGASRLREACRNYIELCNKKNQDKLWIDEVAEMQASSQSQLSYLGTSGIVLADDENGSGVHLPASDQVEVNGKSQPSTPWTNNYSQYFPNYYGPIHPLNMPPYQGYAFPGMHVANPYHPGNMVTDSGHDRESSDGKNKKSARTKEKSSREKVLDTSEQDAITGSSSQSASEESLEGGKKHLLKKRKPKENKKKSSKTVVIRNINYISSKKGGANDESSSDDEELFDGDSIKQQIEEAVGSLHRHRRQKKQLESKHASTVNGSDGFNLGNLDTKEIENEGGKVRESWDAFQNILMRVQETNTDTVDRVQIENDIFTAYNSEGSVLPRQRIAGSDSCIVNRDDGDHEDRTQPGKFDAGDSFRPSVKNFNGTDEMMMLSRGNEEQGNFIRITQSDYAARSATVNSNSEEDWYINTGKNGSSYSDSSLNQKVLEGEYTSSVNSSTWIDKGKNDIVDDSLMVNARGHQHGSELKTDLSIVLDIPEATPQKNNAGEKPQDKRESSGTFEPDDMYMIPDRSFNHEPVWASWTPEIDYENIVKMSEAGKNHSSGEPKEEDDETAKVNGKGAPRSKALGGPLGKSKSEILSRSRKPFPVNKTTVRKSKQELEEERRLRMEELLIQRQKRIAERKSKSVTGAALNKETADIKRSIKSEKPPIKSVIQDKKLTARSSTIDRLATARISKYVSEAQSTTSQSKKATPKAAVELKKSVGKGTKKPAPSKEKPLDKKSSVNNRNGALTSKSDISEKVDTAEIGALPPVEVVASPAPTLAIDRQTNRKDPDDLEALRSDISDKKDSLVLPLKVTLFPAPEPAVDDTEEVKESQTWVPLDENKEKELSPSRVDVSTDIVAAEEKNTSDSEPTHLKALDQGIAEQNSMVKATDAVIKSPSYDALAKDTESLAPNTKQTKGPSVTFSPTTKISEIPASTPPSTIGFSPELIPSRKKWDNNDYSNSNSTKVAKGLKKLLMFGRKSRPISYA